MRRIARAARTRGRARLTVCGARAPRSVDEPVERFRIPVRVAALRFRERLEPIGDFFEAFVARSLRHARIHIGVLVRLARYRRLQILAGCAERQPRRRIADRFQVFEVAVRVARFALGGRAEQRRDVVLPLDVRLRREVEVAAIRLRFAGERVFQVLFGLAALELCHLRLPIRSRRAPRRAG
ncbi:hypothetical protein DM77_1002 [Burkholderia mallei]|nr:hypothetical protein DM77_1002 [Burkholderia mallei]KOT22071.1 hypothetical protein DM52_1928 [Burkholderia mallei]